VNRRVQENFDDARERLVHAATEAGADPAVVIRIAGFESAGFNPDARPVTGRASVDRVAQFDGVMAMSSAHGYGQFTNATWQAMVNRYGERYGVEGAADLSTAEANSAELRTDRDLQALMLAEFTRENIDRGRALGETDDNVAAYAMHNLGAAGGARFLEALAQNPQQTVDAALTDVEIRNNPALYRENGELVTLEVARQRMQGHLSRYDDYVEQAREHHPDAFAGVPERAAREAAPRGEEPSVRRSSSGFADGVFSEGDRGVGVRILQQRLSDAGYVGLDGEPIRPDEAFGPNTAHAVRELQAAHGLEVDAKAGMHTLCALSEELENGRPPPALPEAERSPDRFEDASHWRGTQFQNARAFMRDLDTSMGLTPGETTDRVAAALTAEWHEQNARGPIDGVVLGQRGAQASAGEYVFAYSGSPERPTDFVGIRTSDAIEVPIDQSMNRAQEAVRQQALEAQQWVQAQAQQQASDGPRMSLA
jgi:peptidoglycan hydrolase-like protein with peptidoglycan-binding domain